MDMPSFLSWEKLRYKMCRACKNLESIYENCGNLSLLMKDPICLCPFFISLSCFWISSMSKSFWAGGWRDGILTLCMFIFTSWMFVNEKLQDKVKNNFFSRFSKHHLILMKDDERIVDGYAAGVCMVLLWCWCSVAEDDQNQIWNVQGHTNNNLFFLLTSESVLSHFHS